MAEMNRISRFFVNAFTVRRNARRFRRLAGRLSLPAKAECLEIGCGNGGMAERIVNGLAPARYAATDLDSHQIESARRHLSKRYPGGIPSVLELREADMLQLPFADASFDAVFAFVSIHHASPNHHDPANVPQALAEVDRVLRPKGVFVYEEILYKEVLRAWLTEHGYFLEPVEHGWARETTLAVKAGGTARDAPQPPASR